VEIDLEEGDVSLETEDRVTALVANLPIRRAKAVVKPAADADAEAAPEPAASKADEPVWTASQA
jgi:cell division topological specificity factor